MSPVLPLSSRLRPRRPVRRPAVHLLPFCSDAQDPKPEAGALAEGSPGWRTGSLESPSADCPPPHLATPPVPLVGIARLAAKSPTAQTKRSSAGKPEYFFLPVKSILNHCDSKRVPFDWTVNPYRGCEFGCYYCYARYTHEYMEIDGREFERKIYVKQQPDVLLTRDLNQKYSFRSDGAPEHIAIGTATDPYQPAEHEFGVTRACLEELARRQGLSVSIITKSNQVVRDVELLQRIAARSTLSIQLSVTTMKARLARLLEPRAPRPDLRIGAVKQLREAGLGVGVF